MTRPQAKKTIQAAAIGGLMGVGLLHPLLWPLTIIGIALTLHLADGIQRTRNVFIAGWVIGTTKALVSLIWFWSVYPVDWLGLKAGPLQLFLVGMYWVPAGITLGLGIAVALLARKFLIVRFPAISIVATAGVWTVGESLGSVSFSIASWGAGSTTLVGFSFGQVGYALAAHELFLGAARYGGVFILTFTAVLLAVFLYTAPRRYALLGGIVIVLLGYVPITLPTSWVPSGETVAFYSTAHSAIHPDDEAARKRRAAKDVAMVAATAPFSPDYIILPEDTRLSASFRGSNEFFKAIGITATYTPIIIDSMSMKKAEGKTVQALVHDTKNLKTYVFEKQFLVPQGEYTPYVYEKILAGVNLVRPVTPQLTHINFRPGISQTDVPLPGIVPPVLFCFESVTPFGVKNITGNRPHPPFVAHVVSHAWFKHEPEVFWHQLDAMLKVQSVWAQIPIVQSANETEAKIYMPDGSITRPSAAAEGSVWKLYTMDL